MLYDDVLPSLPSPPATPAVAAVLLFGLTLLLPGADASAQSDARSRSSWATPDDGTVHVNRSSQGNLPGWAEPASSDEPSYGRRSDARDVVGKAGAPPPPGVPVDGELGLLALAGAIYAVVRLRRETKSPQLSNA